MIYRLKGVLQSEDEGKTWYVTRIDYITCADAIYDKFSFVTDNVKEVFETLKLERIGEES